MSKNLWSVEDVCVFIGVSKSTVYRMTMNRTIPHIKIGGRVTFDPELIAKWLKDQARGPGVAS